MKFLNIESKLTIFDKILNVIKINTVTIIKLVSVTFQLLSLHSKYGGSLKT